MDFTWYRQQLLEQREGQIALAELVRNFSQWFFELLRNFVLVGGLKYFSERSGSAILFYLHEFALGVLLLYCLSYADQWYLNLFSFLENRRLAHVLNRTVNISIAIGMFLLIRWAAHTIVAEISHAQTKT